MPLVASMATRARTRVGPASMATRTRSTARCSGAQPFGGNRKAPASRATSAPVSAQFAAAQASHDIVRSATPLPPTVNWHLIKHCNYSCSFCFATFGDIPASEVLHERARLLQVPAMLADAGVSKINFVGGEPFLHPLIDELIAAAKASGLSTSVVTNASLLDAGRLRSLRADLDVLGVSVDASTDALHAATGRGTRRDLSAAAPTPPSGAADSSSGHLARVLQLWPEAQELGFTLKVNTVVCRANLHDDMSRLIAHLKPHRWKVFQVLPVPGQNTGRVEPLLVTTSEFDAYVERHRLAAAAVGVPLVPESNDAMTGSYAMLDARGRFYTNCSSAAGSGGGGRPSGGASASAHEYGPSVFEAGSVAAAWAALAGQRFRPGAFVGRDGVYGWGQGEGELGRQREEWEALAAAADQAQKA